MTIRNLAAVTGSSDDSRGMITAAHEILRAALRRYGRHALDPTKFTWLIREDAWTSQWAGLEFLPGYISPAPGMTLLGIPVVFINGPDRPPIQLVADAVNGPRG